MAHSRDLASRFEAYSDWRRRLSGRISGVHDWLQQQDLADAQVDLRVQQLLERLHQDKLIVAFVAEFSRGKSELINAIFFADFGQRLLPSSAGRTTMCPTELLFDPALPPSIRLLPIETRMQGAGVAEFKSYDEEWLTIPLDLAAADQMGEALQRVAQVKCVPATLAAQTPRQIEDSARTLGVPVEQVFAVSAQKALLAKVNGDDALLARSCLPALENALSHSLLSAKRDIVGSAILADVRSLAGDVR